MALSVQRSMAKNVMSKESDTSLTDMNVAEEIQAEDKPNTTVTGFQSQLRAMEQIDLSHVLNDFKWDVTGDAGHLEARLVSELQALDAVTASSISFFLTLYASRDNLKDS